MADGIQVDLAALRRGGEGLQRAAQQLEQEWSAFSGRVQSMGDIFGDDMVGGLIGASYHAAHEIADESFMSAADGLDGFGAGLMESADNHEATDQSGAESFQQMTW
jgi:hypothetical protein